VEALLRAAGFAVVGQPKPRDPHRLAVSDGADGAGVQRAPARVSVEQSMADRAPTIASYAYATLELFTTTQGAKVALGTSGVNMKLKR
jgi:hypothetical protein